VKIFCSGIGGIGLSAYAAYQRGGGHDVSGSDACDSQLLKDLRSQGVPVATGQDGGAVPGDADLFVYTLALRDDHPEFRKAKRLGIPCKSYFEALGELTSSWKNAKCEDRNAKERKLIAVCGTHGKSSTTAMVAKVLIESGMDPSVILGTKTQELENRNWRRGEGTYFLVEACEYHRSFLHLSTDIILLTNADGDHFDYFKTHEDYISAFGEFVATLPKEGSLITHCSDEHCREIATCAPCAVLDADSFPLAALSVPGSHMQENAKLVLALSQLLKIPQEQALQSLASYTGCWRRMEAKGKSREGAIIIDDYGHHPVEVSATLRALREAHPGKRIVCVFQPHTHDRTIKLYDQFVRAFRDADEVVISNIYDARKNRDSGVVDLTSFVNDVQEKSKVTARNGEGLERTSSTLQKSMREDDVIVTMGAGDVWKVGEALIAS
jgi:UDP-N-acetylmuramate--alanine ligase